MPRLSFLRLSGYFWKSDAKTLQNPTFNRLLHQQWRNAVNEPGLIRTDEQEKKVAELEQILNERD